MNIERWLNHFRENQKLRPEPDWAAPMDLPAEAVRKLLPSLQQFELGDGGGPAFLIAYDRDKFLEPKGIRALVELWFREEAEHSRLLGDAVRRFNGTKISDHWSFSVFCLLRKYLGVRFEIRTLLLTEIVSNVYYRMLRRHSGDVALQAMCDLIIRDETGHIAFHRDRLADPQNPGFGFIRALLFHLMGTAAGTMLWINHASALRPLGGTTREFYREIHAAMGHFIEKLRRDRRSRSRSTSNKDTISRPAGIHALAKTPSSVASPRRSAAHQK